MEVQKLCKSYDDRPVLQNVSFTAENGVTALWGPSGAGKTTLLRILMGLEVPDSGTLSGTDVRWSAVFQEDRLLPGLDAMENLRFVLGPDMDNDAAAAQLRALGLDPSPGQCVRSWSGGMRRRLALARALLAGQHVDALYDFKLSRDGELGMACGGDVTVLFTPARLSDRVWDALAAEVLRCVRDRVPGWLVLPLDGAAPHIAETAETGEGVFSLPLPVGERAVIFGAGHIARALTPLLRTVGFRPVVVDDRPGFATAEHFPQADRTICGDFDRISDYLTLTPEDYVVIMTNGHEHDFQAEVQVLRGETAYVGVIGSRKKTAFVNQRLREAGIPEEKIAFVHTPVGTPIKAVTPEEIAVSIAGEMICVRAARREAAGEVHHGCPMH